MVEKVEYSVQLFYFFWYFEVGVYMNDFKTKAINGIGDNLLKILSVNLTYDSYNVIKDITKENNDKKENYYLVTVLGNKKIDLKKFRIENGLRHL